MKKHLSSFLSAINKLEDWFLIIVLAIMVILAIAQIFFRNVFSEGVVWIDPLLRMLVLWVAIAGAMVATRTDNHIRIDFFSRYIAKKYHYYLQRLVYIFSSLVCGVIGWHGVRFVQMDYEFETIAFANVPAWVTELIIPIGFFMMSIRYMLLIFIPAERDENKC